MKEKSSTFVKRITSKMNAVMEKFKIGDTVFISPHLTQSPNWQKAKVIEVNDNSFNGIVVSAKTDEGEIFFHRAEFFKKEI